MQKKNPLVLLSNIIVGILFTWVSLFFLADAQVAFVMTMSFLSPTVIICTLGTVPMAFILLLATIGHMIREAYTYVLQAMKDPMGAAIARQWWLSVPLGFVVATAIFSLLLTKYLSFEISASNLIRLVYLALVGWFVGTRLLLHFKGYHPTAAGTAAPSLVAAQQDFANQAIAEYITAARQYNMSLDDIRQNLLRAGWLEPQVQAALIGAAPKVPVPTVKRTSRLGTIVLVVAVLVIGGTNIFVVVARNRRSAYQASTYVPQVQRAVVPSPQPSPAQPRAVPNQAPSPAQAIPDGQRATSLVFQLSNVERTAGPTETTGGSVYVLNVTFRSGPPLNVVVATVDPAGKDKLQTLASNINSRFGGTASGIIVSEAQYRQQIFTDMGQLWGWVGSIENVGPMVDLRN